MHPEPNNKSRRQCRMPRDYLTVKLFHLIPTAPAAKQYSLYCSCALCRFRPISAAEVMNQTVNSSVVSGSLETCRVLSHHNASATPHSQSQSPVQSQLATNRRNSRTVLLPSPSSAFSVPLSRHNDTDVCRNTDVNVPETQTTQHHGTPDIECRYRRRGTVKEMAQSYDRATQNDVSTRRLSYTFRPTLPTTTAATTTTTAISSSMTKPTHAITAETRGDNYTTTSVFSLNRSRPESDKVETSKARETKLKRLYSSTVASLYKSLDSFTRPFTADRTTKHVGELTSKVDLRRSASTQQIHSATHHNPRLTNHNNNHAVKTFPLSSRHHSKSIHTLTNLSAQNFRNQVEPEMEKSRHDVSGSGAEQSASKTSRRHNYYSSWNIASPATKRLDSGKTDSNIISTNVRDTDTKKSHEEETSMETKTTEMRVVLDRNLRTEPAKTPPRPRCLTVRQSPSLSLTPTDSNTLLSMAFVSPRPLRKLMHHLQPQTSTSSSRPRPTSAAALERFEDAQQLLIKTADLPSTTSDGQGLKSASPCKTLIELVRESHMNVFPSTSLTPSSPARSSSTSWMTLPEGGNTEVTSTSANTNTAQSQQTAVCTEHSSREAQNKSVTSLVNSGSAANYRNQVLTTTSPVSQQRVTAPVRTVLSVPAALNASVPRFSPSVQPQRAQIGVISPLQSTTTARPTYTSVLGCSHTQHVQTNHRHHHQTSSDVITPTYPTYKEYRLQYLSILPSSSSSSSFAAGAASSVVKPFQLTTALPRSTLHSSDQVRSQGQVQLGQRSGLRHAEVSAESLLTNGYVTAALDSAIELLTLKQSSRDVTITQRHQLNSSRSDPVASNDDLAEVDMSEFGYDLLDEEPTPVVPSKVVTSSERQEHAVHVASSKKDGCRTVKEELEVIQRRRAFQLQRKDDSFDKPAPSADCRDTTSPPSESHCTNTVLSLPRDSVIARYRRRRAARHHSAVVTSSSSSSRDTMTSSSSSSRDSSTDSASETQQSPAVIGRRTLRRRKRLRDPA